MNTKELRAALISYPVGTKFSHPNFSDDEYIIADENRVAHTEDGYECSPEFWEIRKDWTGWYVKEESDDHVNDLMDAHPYYLHNYMNEPVVKTTHCSECKLMRSDGTCPYSKKVIKHPESTSCKYGKK